MLFPSFRKTRLTAVVMCGLLGSSISSAAPLEREVGHGLRFYRIRELPADLPPAPPAEGRVPPCIVDVRYVRADAAAATALEAWLRFRAKPRTPVFVLANAETSPAVLRAVAKREPRGGIVLIGAAGRTLEPDVAVRTTAEDERRAYDALENGAAVASLITENPGKVRNDEESLSRDRLAEASADTAADTLAPKQNPPPIDAALQRAVHLHRALVALRKL